jgi:hypothetical protein
MDLEDVQAILGQPFSIKSLAGMHNLTCEHPRPRLNQTLTKDADIRAIVDEKFSKTDFCCEGNKEDMAEKRVTLIFTEPMKFSRHYPMLWVHLDGDFKVASVTAKQYDGYLGFDDPVIYSMSAADTFEETRLFEESFD